MNEGGRGARAERAAPTKALRWEIAQGISRACSLHHPPLCLLGGSRVSSGAWGIWPAHCTLTVPFPMTRESTCSALSRWCCPTTPSFGVPTIFPSQSHIPMGPPRAVLGWGRAPRALPHFTLCFAPD